MNEATPTLPMVKVQYNVPKAIRMPRSDVVGRKLVSTSCQIAKSTKLLEKLAKDRRKSELDVLENCNEIVFYCNYCNLSRSAVYIFFWSFEICRNILKNQKIL